MNLVFQVHRRLLRDDAFGVGEALNETELGKGLIARGKHFLVFGRKDPTARPTVEAQERFTQLNKMLPCWLFFSDSTQLTYDAWRESYKNIVKLSIASLFNRKLITFSFVYSIRRCHYRFHRTFTC